MDSDFFVGMSDLLSSDVDAANRTEVADLYVASSPVLPSSSPLSRSPVLSEDNHAKLVDGDPGLEGKNPAKLNGSSQFPLCGDIRGDEMTS